jgi:hypothetical protein
VRHAGVRVKRAVGHGVTVADEEVLPREPSLEGRQRGGPGLVVACERLGPFGVSAGQAPEARRADVGLEQVLLEEHPGMQVRPFYSVVGQKRSSLREVQQDRARLGDRRAVLRLEQRRSPGRVPGQVLGGLGVTGEDVDRNALIGSSELGEQHPHLEAVGGRSVVVELDHAGETLPGDGM